jgi:hypothetical protein
MASNPRPARSNPGGCFREFSTTRQSGSRAPPAGRATPCYRAYDWNTGSPASLRQTITRSMEPRHVQHKISHVLLCGRHPYGHRACISADSTAVATSTVPRAASAPGMAPAVCAGRCRAGACGCPGVATTGVATTGVATGTGQVATAGVTAGGTRDQNHHPGRNSGCHSKFRHKRRHYRRRHNNRRPSKSRGVTLDNCGPAALGKSDRRDEIARLKARASPSWSRARSRRIGAAIVGSSFN